MATKSLLDHARALATRATRSHGADACELLLRRSNRQRLVLRADRLERVERHTWTEALLRLWKDGRLVQIREYSISPEDLGKLLERALASLENAGFPASVPKLPSRIRAPKPAIFDPSISSITDAQKLQRLQETNRLAADYSSRIDPAVEAYYIDLLAETILVNSKGLALRYAETRFEVGLNVLARAESSQVPGQARIVKRFWEDLGPAETLVENACLPALMQLGGKPCRPGEYFVVFDRLRTGPALLRATLAQALQADRLAAGTSFLPTRLGGRVGSELLTLIDDPTLARCAGSRPFDDEGTPSRRLTLVEKGILHHPLDTRATAAAAGRKPSGHALHLPNRAATAPRPANLFLAPGKGTAEELIARTPLGILALDLRPLHVDLVTGDFTALLGGRMIRSGEPAEPVADLLIRVLIDDLWTRLDVVADDLDHHLLHGRSAVNTPTFRLQKLPVTPL